MIFPVIMYRCAIWTIRKGESQRIELLKPVVLEKILESPLCNKDFKPVNLKGNQSVTPADSAEGSTGGLQSERMDASTEKVPNHGSSKQIVCSTPLEEA